MNIFKKIKENKRAKKIEKERYNDVLDKMEKLESNVEKEKKELRNLLNNLYVYTEIKRIDLNFNAIDIDNIIKNIKVAIKQQINTITKEIFIYNENYEENEKIIDKINNDYNIAYWTTTNKFDKMEYEGIEVLKVYIFEHLENSKKDLTELKF